MSARKRTYVAISCDWPGCTERRVRYVTSIKEARLRLRHHGWTAVRKGDDRCPKHRGLYRPKR